MNIFKKFLDKFTNNVDYHVATQALKDVKGSINKIHITFPDVNSFDFQLIKNQWEILPNTVGCVQTMGIHVGDDYRSVLVHYEPNSEILPHFHSKEYELIKIVEGSVRNLTNNEIYERGDIVLIPKNKLHHIVSENEECYMYILFTEYSEYLKLPHNEEEFVNTKLTIFNKPH